MEPSALESLYEARFSERDRRFKRALWEILCRDAFQRYVRASDTVLDLGAGSCEFINSIRCARKIAVDLNPRTADFAEGAEVVRASSTDLHPIADATVDVVFCSNFLEHLPDKEAVLQTLRECRRILREGGTAIFLQPNIRYLGGKYWDYFDHHTPLTHLSLAEGLELCGFEVERVVPRFLPYTVKQRVPRWPGLVRLYLRLPFLWRLFGRQMLLVARRPAEAI